MRFRWDWLRRVLCVPFVPTLGPVHPDALSSELFDDVVAASRTGQVLPFDKDRRWSARKDQTVLVKEIIHQSNRTIIPTFSRRGDGVVKTYYYGTTPADRPGLLAATRQWCAAYGARTGQLIWFDPATPVTVTGSASCTRLLLKIFSGDQPPDRPPPDLVRVLDSCPPAVRATFAQFARHL
ncbi:MAG TPA: hypothetical protein VE196_05980, partial [Pseudonocardiaceae bacterium]|nr:hypothetical protein [Pseudonocardiaceae bacterium]